MKTKRKYTTTYTKTAQELHEKVAQFARLDFYKAESFPWGDGVFTVFEQGKNRVQVETFTPTGKTESAGTVR